MKIIRRRRNVSIISIVSSRSEDLGSLIKAIANAKDAEENRRLRPYGITAMQMHVLLYLYDAKGHQLSLKELEHGLYVSQSTMAKMVRNLVEKKHLAEYICDPKDKRIKCVRLTPDAIPICQSAEHIVNDMEAALQTGLTASEVSELRSLLRKVYNHLR